MKCIKNRSLYSEATWSAVYFAGSCKKSTAPSLQAVWCKKQYMSKPYIIFNAISFFDHKHILFQSRSGTKYPLCKYLMRLFLFFSHFWVHYIFAYLITSSSIITADPVIYSVVSSAIEISISSTCLTSLVKSSLICTSSIYTLKGETRLRTVLKSSLT